MLSAEPVSSGLCLITINTWGINLDQEDGVVEVVPTTLYNKSPLNMKYVALYDAKKTL